MEQVLAPRFEFKPKNPESGRLRALIMVMEDMTRIAAILVLMSRQGRIKSRLRDLPSPRAKKRHASAVEDLNEVIAAFVQDKPAIERGLFDEELILKS